VKVKWSKLQHIEYDDYEEGNPKEDEVPPTIDYSIKCEASDVKEVSHGRQPMSYDSIFF